MPESTILLNGIDEGINVKVTSVLEGPESPKLILESIQNVFPDFFISQEVAEPVFGKSVKQIWQNNKISINNFLQMIHKQAILDTALDVMSMNLDNDKTYFEILRQASIVGKIAFNINTNIPLGGVISVELSGAGLPEWLEAATWHKGRDSIPKKIDDERTMEDDGEPSNWI